MSEEKLEEETYSLIFSSLKNPIRRKILRMLAKKRLVFSGMTFSRMLESLSIDSGHLSYHLEKMGDLLTRSENGEYGLSSVGVAAVKLMTGVEDYPEVSSKKWLRVPALKWRIFLIASALIVILIVSWWYMNTPRYETLLYGEIRLTRSDGTPSNWFFYEFEVSRKIELFFRVEPELPRGEYAGLTWHLVNSTRVVIENMIENHTWWFPLVYAWGDIGTYLGAYEKTVMVNQFGSFSFILFLPSYNSVGAVTVKLELSVKNS